MTDSIMNSQYRGQRGYMHAWYVYESSLTAITAESMSPIGDGPLSVIFDYSTERWTCDCRPNEYQPSSAVSCKHIRAACKQIVGTKGPWEQDPRLMQRAWDVIRPSVSDRLDWDRSKNFSTSASGYSTARASYDEIKGVRFEMEGKDITDEVRSFTISRSYADGGILKVSGLKADKLIVDEFTEHKEPEPPKKKRSRFTEIDL